MKLYPNTTADYLQIETDAIHGSNGVIGIIKAGGFIMQSGRYKLNSNIVTIAESRPLPAGKYFLKTNIDKLETSTLFVKK